ncbi:pre-mRNA-splicing factor cwc2 [Drechslerella stenobrocha 248]|uniref:Pre-mRNA-splicing factor CWC2 n=1 Tax=Drechslerella stenobrocha 248 TaxID=1043628 RepID=W7HPK9_9PEZI|nr:pre-mRNA-splicing factor cwc2 [Drechslerella stenobrocha 248]
MADADTALATRAPELDAQEDQPAADPSTDTTVAVKSTDTAVAAPPPDRKSTLPASNPARSPSRPAQSGTSGITRYVRRRTARSIPRAHRLSGKDPPANNRVQWSGGDREDKYISKHHAEGRCDIAKDSGYTKADRVPGSYFCLFFARGLCPHGHQCEYLHRLPTIHDLFNPNIDSFGRDKHSDYRDDMGGVGSFMRQNRTLYIGRIHVSDDIEEIVARHFAEWGQVERIRVLNSRGVAFVTYTNEANAQFAKEAMAHQSLDHSEILNVRWATVDPNPLAQARDKRRIEEQAAEAIRKALPAEYVAELEGKDPEARKRRRMESSFGLQGYEAPEQIWYNRGADAVNPVGRQGYEHIEGVERAGLLEAPPAEEAAGGILSGSTLAALKNYAQKTQGGSTVKVAEKATGGGPLVAYDSDDDSD